MRFIILCVLFVIISGNSAFASSCLTFDRIVSECENGKCQKAFRVAHDLPNFCDSIRSIVAVDDALLARFEKGGVFTSAGVYEAKLSVREYSSDNSYFIDSYEKLSFKNIEEAREHWVSILWYARMQDIAWNFFYGTILFFYFLIIVKQFHARVIRKGKGDNRLVILRMTLIALYFIVPVATFILLQLSSFSQIVMLPIFLLIGMIVLEALGIIAAIVYETVRWIRTLFRRKS